MKNKLIITAALSLAGLVGSIQAQEANIGDMIIGFQASAGTGSATNVEVDLGSISAFTALGAGTFQVGNFGTDLTNTYGSWSTDASLKFGIVGVSDSNGDIGSNAVASPQTIWAGANGNPGTAYVAVSTAAQASATGKVQGVYGLSSAPGSFVAPDTVLSDINSESNQIGTSLNAISTSNSESGAWTKLEGSGNNFGISGASSRFLSSTNIGSGTAVSTLYEIQPTDSGASPTVVDLGFFTLDNTGNLTFTTFTAIPEPSTYAAILGAISIGFAVIRRRKNVLA